MALLKAARVSDVPSLDVVVVPDLATARIDAVEASTAKQGPFAVIGHRGKGMNALASPDRRLQEVKENSVRSFNEAARFAVDYVEFDVQGKVSEKRVTDLQLEEFLQYGPQNKEGKNGKPLLRKMKDGRILNWDVQSDDPLCTLQEAFEKVNPKLGFNVELKFDDNLVYGEEELRSTLHAILKVVFEHAKDRAIIFSSFQPDAAVLMRKLQNAYPVYFLTNGGTETFADVRRNSLEEAVKLCVASGMQGIVSEARGLFRFPAAVPKIKEADLSLLTYGTLNNVPEAVYMQRLMGVNGVIVDLVPEITQAISAAPQTEALSSGKVARDATSTPSFTEQDLSFLLRLVRELVQ